MLTYEQARHVVLEKITSLKKSPAREQIDLGAALRRVLAATIVADRAYPPFDRSLRDGFAVRANEARAGAILRIAREIKAGDEPGTPLSPGTCAQIMTGAALPPVADAVVMIEHVNVSGNEVTFTREALTGQHLVKTGAEAKAGATLLETGIRLGYAEIAVAAQVGATRVEVFSKPRVAILSTGDEILDAEKIRGPYQIRNSNAYSLAAQVELAGGDAVLFGNARDEESDLRRKIEEGLRADLLVLSGGVSMGKYDLVENVLRDLGADVVFDSVAIRPGKPAVFCVCKGKPVFGLPGNPISTMVTFELFVKPALQLLSGAQALPLAFLQARLNEGLKEKAGLAHFLPARVEWNGVEATVRVLRWQGSGDLAAISKANCFLLIPSDREILEAGEMVSILLRQDVS